MFRPRLPLILGRGSYSIPGRRINVPQDRLVLESLVEAEIVWEGGTLTGHPTVPSPDEDEYTKTISCK